MLVTASILLLISLVQCVLGQPSPPTLRSNQPKEVVTGSEVIYFCETASDVGVEGRLYEFANWPASDAGSPRVTVRPASADSHFTISDLTQGDSGFYECRETQPQVTPYSNRLEMRVVDIPAAPNLIPKGQQEAQIGSSLTITCKTRTGGDVEYTFTKDGEEVQKSLSNKYTIEGLTLEDYGRYRCVAAGPGGPADSLNALVVKTPPEPPALSSNPPETDIVSGSELTLTCTSATGDDDSLTYTFYKDRIVVRPASRDNTYTIDSVDQGDSGRYECGITKTLTTGSTSITPNSDPYQLSVVVGIQSPSLTPSGQQEVQLGSSLTITCKTTTGGSITYDFYQDGQRVQRSVSTTYTIEDFSMDDYGTYTCGAAGPVAGIPSEDSLELTAPPGLLQAILNLLNSVLGLLGR